VQDIWGGPDKKIKEKKDKTRDSEKDARVGRPGVSLSPGCWILDQRGRLKENQEQGGVDTKGGGKSEGTNRIHIVIPLPPQ